MEVTWLFFLRMLRDEVDPFNEIIRKLILRVGPFFSESIRMRGEVHKFEGNRDLARLTRGFMIR